MAEPANKLVLEVVKNDCSSVTCPYRYGDDSHSKRFLEKIDRKLKYRVADGNEVRDLKKRVGELEVALSRATDIAEKRKLNPQEVLRYRSISSPKVKR
jgi:hypothetical protein